MTVARDLVPRLGDAADYLRIPLRRDSENEERRVRPKLLEQGEDRLDLPLERRVPPIPIYAPISPMNELVPILDVEAEQERRPLVHPSTVAQRDAPDTRRSVYAETTRPLPASFAR